MRNARDFLAIERTLLAWVRTGVALVGLGIVLAKFYLVLLRIGVHTGGETARLGVALVVAGGLTVAGAAVRFASDTARVRAGRPIAPYPFLGLFAAALVVAIAAYAAVAGAAQLRVARPALPDTRQQAPGAAHVGPVVIPQVAGQRRLLDTDAP